MSQQTVEKLRRLLAIEVAKREAAEAARDKAWQAYVDELYKSVLYRVRCEQAMQILTGEVDD